MNRMNKAKQYPVPFRNAGSSNTQMDDPRNKAFLVCSHTEFLWKEMSKCRFSFAEHLLLPALQAVSKNSCWAEQAFGSFCIILGLVLFRCSAAWAHPAPWAWDFGSSAPASYRKNVLLNLALILSVLLSYSQFKVLTLLFPPCCLSRAEPGRNSNLQGLSLFSCNHWPLPGISTEIFIHTFNFSRSSS